MANYNDTEKIYQPKELGVNLYPHQLVSIWKMEILERDKKVVRDEYIKETKMGINANMTGYGKTVSFVALILRDKMEWDLDEIYYDEEIIVQANNQIVVRNKNKYDRLRTTLVLANSSIVKQWEYEFKRATKLNVFLAISTTATFNVEPNDYDVIIVIPKFFNSLVRRFPLYAWKRFLFDEPGHVSVSKMVQPVAGFSWYITATPDLIKDKHYNQNNSCMHHLIPKPTFYTDVFTISEYYKDVIIKLEDTFVKQSFAMPHTHHIYYKCYSSLYKIIKGFVPDSVLNMVSAGDIKGALQVLGSQETGNILDSVKNYKLEEMEEIETRIAIYTIRKNREKVEEWEERKLRMENSLKEIDNRIVEMLKGDCPICLQVLQNPVMEPLCNTISCGSCLITWLNNKPNCPFCRSAIDTSNLIYISDGGDNNGSNSNKKICKERERPKNKLEQLLDIIVNKRDNKFIIFSDYENIFCNVCTGLEDEGVEYVQIRGSIRSKEKSIQQFKDGIVNVILLNSQYNGSGINLQEATDIILYHKMSRQDEKQIIGRANRIGRTCELTVHHLVDE